MVKKCKKCGATLSFKSYWLFRAPPINTVKCFSCNTNYPVRARYFYFSIAIGLAISLPVSIALLEGAVNVAAQIQSSPLRRLVEGFGVLIFLVSFLLLTQSAMRYVLGRRLQ